MNLQNIRDDIGVRLRGYNFNTEIINACPLRCPSCPTGNYKKGDGTVMTFEKFVQILDHAQKNFIIRRWAPYVGGDPMLHPELPRFIREVKRRGIFIMFASTLNKINCDLEEVMASGIDDMRISWSGWEHYEEHHRGGNLDTVLANIERVSKFKVKPKRITLLFHRYKDNAKEEDRARAYAAHLGIGCDPFDAQFLTLEKLMNPRDLTREDKGVIDSLCHDPWDYAMKHAGVSNCYYQRKCIQLDAHAQVMLCCRTRYPFSYLGDFFKMDFKDTRRTILNHQFCQKCMSSGISRYAIIEDSSL
jgi:MoaA/NifB/PqqE/SkfB family radical SAM enzyme